MRAILKNDRGISLVVVLMIMVLLLSITGAGLIFSGTGLRTVGAYRAGNQALYAADTGISQAVTQLALDPAVATVAISPVNMGGGVSYRSGPRNAVGAQPFGQPTPRYPTDCSMGSGTANYSGSQSGGCVSYRYQINVTGTGPIGAAREIEAQTEFGPIPQ